MSSRWYYQMLMEEFGPVTAEQLRELFEEGTLSDFDLVRCETDDVWTTIAAVKPSLFADSGDRPVDTLEEIGDLSELAFEFEGSGPTTRRGAYPQESAEDPRPVSMGPVAESRMQNPTPITADSVSLVASPHVLAPPLLNSDQPAEEWFCESFGQVLGPMSFAELIELGESGALDARDRVRCGVRGLWKTGDCLPSMMRAVAVGSAIEIDPAGVSVTTQQRSGEGSATVADTMSVPVEPIAAQPRVHEPRFTSSVEPSTAVPPQEPETVLTKSKGRNNRTKRRRNTKGEEKMLDEIFDDVFNDDSPPARSNPAAQSFAALSATASASQESSRAAGDRRTAAATVTRPSAKSSRSSFEANPATIGMLVAVMLVAAGGWYVWQNGIPSFSGSGNGNGTFDTAGAVKVLQATMDRYKAVVDGPSESEWKKFSEKTRMELSALFKAVYDQAGSTPNGASCLEATRCLMKIARSKPDNKEFIDMNMAEFDRQLALVTK